MTWIRVNDEVVDDEKADEAGDAALGALLRLEAWAARHLTDRVIPLARVKKLGASHALKSLRQAKLIEDVGPESVRIVANFFHVLTAEEVLADRAAAAKRQAQVREKRRQGRANGVDTESSHAVTSPVTIAVIPAVTTPVSHSPPTRPDPSRPVPIEMPRAPRDQIMGDEKGAEDGPPPLALRDFERLWVDVLQASPGDRYPKTGTGDRWRALCVRIGTDAVLLKPPMTAAEYAEALMRAFVPYQEHCGRTGQKVPSKSVAAFEGWFTELAAWVARTRGKAPRLAAPKPQEDTRPEPTAAELAEAAETMDRLLRRGKYGAQGADDDMPTF